MTDASREGLVQISDDNLANALVSVLLMYPPDRRWVEEAARRLRAASLEARRMPDLREFIDGQRELRKVASWRALDAEGILDELEALAGHGERPATPAGYVTLKDWQVAELQRKAHAYDSLQLQGGERPATPVGTAEETSVEDREVAWVIERGDLPAYWDGRGRDTFVRDHLLAIRFSREQDAYRVKSWLLADDCRVVEHVWLGGVTRDVDAHCDYVEQRLIAAQAEISRLLKAQADPPAPPAARRARRVGTEIGYRLMARFTRWCA